MKAIVTLGLVLLIILASPVAAQTSASKYITVQDIEKLTGLKGLKEVPYDPKKGAGGDLNFADKDGNMVLMTQKSASLMFYDPTKVPKKYVKGDLTGIGDAAFYGPADPPQYYINFKKGSRSGAVATFLNFKTGKTYLSMDQLKEVAKFVVGKL
jgi:hypothetical protein